MTDDNHKTLFESPDATRDHEKKMSGTMPISLGTIVEDMSLESAAHLDITFPGQNPLKISLSENDMVIGRDPDCAVQIALSNVSRHHARLIYDGEEYVIEDLNSTNGTFVNGVKISRCILRNNDQIRIGEAKILFVQQEILDKS